MTLQDFQCHVTAFHGLCFLSQEFLLANFNSSSSQGHILSCRERCAARAISRVKSCHRPDKEREGKKVCPVFLVPLDTELTFFPVFSSFSLPYIHYSGMR